MGHPVDLNNLESISWNLLIRVKIQLKRKGWEELEKDNH